MNNAITPGTVEYFPLLTDLPANFGNAETAEITVRYAGVNFINDSVSLYAQLFEGDETTTLSNEVLVVTVTADAPFNNTSAITFTGLDTGKGKSVWDAAKLRLRWA